MPVGEARLVGRGVDAAGETGGDDVTPASPRPAAICIANFRPATEALREPTMATIGRGEAGDVAADGDQRRRAVDVRAAQAG